LGERVNRYVAVAVMHRIIVLLAGSGTTAMTTPTQASVTRETPDPPPDITYLWVVTVGLLGVLLLVVLSVVLAVVVRRRWIQCKYCSLNVPD